MERQSGQVLPQLSWHGRARLPTHRRELDKEEHASTGEALASSTRSKRSTRSTRSTRSKRSKRTGRELGICTHAVLDIYIFKNGFDNHVHVCKVLHIIRS